jgi:hypothetical protein
MFEQSEIGLEKRDSRKLGLATFREEDLSGCGSAERDVEMVVTVRRVMIQTGLFRIKTSG